MNELIQKGEKLSRKLATSHYENFAIATTFLPERKRQDLFNIYAFCRLADDFADETSDKSKAVKDLDRWETYLEEAYCGVVKQPIFAALADTIQRRNLSIENFRNLLTAFKQDLTKNRYNTWQELRDYTRLSADPVGRIVLELNNERNADNFVLSDKICTGLQLANHWQDIYDDFKRGRIYIPLEDMQRLGINEDDLENRRISDEFIELMKFEIKRTREFFQDGKTLLNLVKSDLKIQLNLYWRGGMAALDAIENINYDVLNKTARVKKHIKTKILFKSFLSLIFKIR